MASLARLRRFSQDKLPLILGVYLILQPLLDVLTALGAQAGHSMTAGVLVRTLFMVLALLYVVFVSRFREKKWCLLFLGALIVYLALFMLYMLSLGGLALCVANLKEMSKLFFVPLVAIFLFAVYREHGVQVSTRAIAIAGALYADIILIAFLTGTSFITYTSSGFGYKGWFYAANEVSCIIALAAPVTIYYSLKCLTGLTRKTWWQGVVIVFTLIAIAFSANFIGTKIVFGVTLLYCVIAFFWCLSRLRRDRSRRNVIPVVTLGILCLLILGIFLYSPFRDYFDKIYLPLINEDPDLIMASWSEEIDRASSGTWLRALTSNNDFVKRLDQILSRRLTSSSPSVQVYTEGGILAKLLGIGYANVPAYGRSIEFMVEIDPLSILVRHGILGFLLYYVPYLVFIIYTIKQFFNRAVRRAATLEYYSYLYSTLMAFAISLIAGHALVSPAVSTFMLVVSFHLWALVQEKKNGCLPERGS